MTACLIGAGQIRRRTQHSCCSPLTDSLSVCGCRAEVRAFLEHQCSGCRRKLSRPGFMADVMRDYGHSGAVRPEDFDALVGFAASLCCSEKPAAAASTSTADATSEAAPSDDEPRRSAAGEHAGPQRSATALFEAKRTARNAHEAVDRVAALAVPAHQHAYSRLQSDWSKSGGQALSSSSSLQRLNDENERAKRRARMERDFAQACLSRRQPTTETQSASALTSGRSHGTTRGLLPVKVTAAPPPTGRGYSTQYSAGASTSLSSLSVAAGRSTTGGSRILLQQSGSFTAPQTVTATATRTVPSDISGYTSYGRLGVGGDEVPGVAVEESGWELQLSPRGTSFRTPSQPHKPAATPPQQLGSMPTATAITPSRSTAPQLELEPTASADRSSSAALAALQQARQARVQSFASLSLNTPVR